MPKKTKFFLLLFGILGIGFHPTLAFYRLGLTTSDYLGALAAHFAIFIGSFVIFYIAWKYLPFKPKGGGDDPIYRGGPGLLGYACLFLGVPFAISASVFSFFVTKTTEAENGLGPSMIGGAVAGLILCYPLRNSRKTHNQKDTPDQKAVR